MSENDSPHKHSLHEASHTVAVTDPLKAGDDKVRTGKRPATKRTFNEASHKLGYWGPQEPADTEAEAERSASALRRSRTATDVITDASKLVLALGALGVVYGDIGTSPLYTEQVIFTLTGATTPAGIYGAVSLIFWALTIVVSLKYAGFIMRATTAATGASWPWRL